MLVHLLRSNPRIQIHGEVILRSGVGAITGIHKKKMTENQRYSEMLSSLIWEDPNKFLNEFIFDSQGKSAVGFKYKLDESTSDLFSTYTNLIVKDRAIAIINLRRRNLLEQFISYTSVTKLNLPTLLRLQDPDLEVQPFELSLIEFVKYCHLLKQREMHSNTMYRGHRNFELYYEDIVDPSHATLFELQEYLNVEPIQLSHGTKKNLTNVNYLVINYAELLSWYNNSEFKQI